MAVRRGSYGVDAPLVPVVFGALSLVALASLVAALVANPGVGSVIGPLVPAVAFGLCLVSYLYTTRRGKFEVWDEVLDGLALAPADQVLDLGCGRGAVLLAAAGRLGSAGRVTGVDLWRSVDQSGNAEEQTRSNAAAEGVGDRIELLTGDLRELPFADDTYDAVLSSLAIHNLKPAADRERAALEGLRVLRAGGAMAIVDLSGGLDYLRLLEERLDGARLRPAGWRMWWGGPFYRSWVLTGTKPG